MKSRLAMISPDERSEAGERVAGHLLGDEAVQAAGTILAYAALPTELDLDPFIRALLTRAVRVCVPAVDWESKSMTPVEIRDLDRDLRSGRYGVRGPQPGCMPVEPSEIDLIVLPGLGFDRRGNRLGRGAGFYDRMLGAMRRQSLSAHLIGVCYEIQLVDEVPVEEHDHPVDRVITEQGGTAAV